MNKTFITLFDLKLLEPSTFISDISLGIASFLFYRYIKNLSVTKTHKYYSFFFLFMSLSGFIGGFAHFLFLYTGKSLQYVGWLMSGVAVYLIEMAVFSYISDEKKRMIATLLIRFRFIAIYILALIFMDFLFVKINIAIGLLLVVSPILIFQFFNFGQRNNLYIILGIFLAILPALLHSFKFNFGGWLDMNDFSHYFLIVCLFFMFLGVKGLIETEVKTSSPEV